ncbi:MAG TPA: hypothetical protein VGM37_04705 [Armatimonadota bacterium]|jgi:hypothetical protein
MPIPFHDSEDIREMGAAAFFHVEPPQDARNAWTGALFVINARGEPLEFAYNRVELLSGLLWRPGDRDPAAARRLAASLFEEVTLEPRMLFCLAGSAAAEAVNGEGQFQISIPVGRVGGAEGERVQTLDREGHPVETSVAWPAPLPEGADKLFQRLAQRGLLLEPFHRAERGLREVYGAAPDEEA